MPDLLLAPDGWRKEQVLWIDSAGLVAGIGPPPEGFPEGVPVERLPGRVLLPGLVNAHSHAFQRALRGRAESRGDGPDDFWSWRSRMYHLALTLSPEQLRVVSRMAFLEMLLSGITSVGEFHYLHRSPQGTPYSDPNLLAGEVIGASDELGLRIVLLRVAYARAGQERAAEGAQLRFCDGSLDAFAKASEQLEAAIRNRPRVSMGLAPHSVRALPRDWLRPIGELALRHGWVVHMHLSEQPREVESCRAEHGGLRPVELVATEGLLSPAFTAVHAIHLSPEEIRSLGRAQSTVCACPSTERNLGDGVVPAVDLLAAGVPLALGSDSQATVDLLEDARELELHLRLTRGARCLIGAADADSSRQARVLWEAATIGGARSLGLPVGNLEVGRPADFFTLALEDPSLAGSSGATLLASIVFGASPRAVREVAVGGRWLVRQGRHAAQEEILSDFSRVQEELWAQI
jgi:formimidoylglutamate deiminase